MKKFILFLAFAVAITISNVPVTQAFQDDSTELTEEEAAAQAEAEEAKAQAEAEAAAKEAEAKAMAEKKKAEEEAAALAEENKSFDQKILEKFLEGGVFWMTPPLICLILGLAISIERIISLNLATTNTKKLLAGVEEKLSAGGVAAARDYTAGIKGPVASIFNQGLQRHSEGLDMVEKSIVSYGSVEMGKLEKGFTWISLFIALAPMLGFMGTVVGMIGAFDAIQAAGDIQPSLVAGGIKVALLTTVAGLIVAVILQVFYNYLVSKVDSLVNNMEEASISMVDLLVDHNLSK